MSDVVVIYAWPDGSEIRTHPEGVLPGGRYVPLAFLRSWSPYFPISLSARVMTDGRRELGIVGGEGHLDLRGSLLLRGFALDVDADRELDRLSKNLVEGARDNPYLASARTVPDVLWERRGEEIVRRLHPLFYGLEPFLGCVENLFVLPPGRKGDRDSDWIAGWNSTQAEALSPEGLADVVCRREFLVPESSLRAWEAEHSVRGEFLLPSPSEFEVLRLLGEPHPIWWGPGRYLEWLQDRDD